MRTKKKTGEAKILRSKSVIVCEEWSERLLLAHLFIGRNAFNFVHWHARRGMATICAKKFHLPKSHKNVSPYLKRPYLRTYSTHGRLCVCVCARYTYSAKSRSESKRNENLTCDMRQEEDWIFSIRSFKLGIATGRSDHTFFTCISRCAVKTHLHSNLDTRVTNFIFFFFWTFVREAHSNRHANESWQFGMKL